MCRLGPPVSSRRRERRNADCTLRAQTRQPTGRPHALPSTAATAACRPPRARSGFAACPDDRRHADDAPPQLCTGFVYTHDSWDRYWEGPLERGNGNIGTITTQSVTWMGTYGVTDRLNVIAMVPWVATRASAGALHGMDGLQDLTVAAKWNALDTELSPGTLQAFLVASGPPLSDYTPDFLPLSIGLASRRVSGRLSP